MVATTGTTTATATGEGLPPATRTAFRTCPLCEAGCGLEIGLAGTNGDARVTRIRGDRDDVFSHGFICPKGSTLKQLHDDPDWLRRPLVKRDGALRRGRRGTRRSPRSSAGSLPVVDEHGRDAVAVYVGNPNAHTLAGLLYLRPADPGARHPQRVLGQHRRPAAEGGGVRPDVRRRRSPSRCPTSTAPTSC